MQIKSAPSSFTDIKALFADIEKSYTKNTLAIWLRTAMIFQNKPSLTYDRKFIDGLDFEFVFNCNVMNVFVAGGIYMEGSLYK